jgi:DNA-binding NarL/FixJ family response regulator
MTNGNCIRILSVDGHPLFREGVAAVINSQSDMTLAGTASDGSEGIEAFRVLRPDVILIDLRLPDRSGLDVIIAIRSEFPDARVIVLTAFDGDIHVQRALKAGARGYLLKSMPAQQMLDMIRQVHVAKKCVPPEIAAGLAEHLGEEALSQRETEVLQQVAAGHRNRDIAAKLFIGEETVKPHIRHIMNKLGANDRTQSVTIPKYRRYLRLIVESPTFWCKRFMAVQQHREQALASPLRGMRIPFVSVHEGE